MKKYKVLVRGANFLINLEGELKKFGFYTTVFVVGQDDEQAEQRAIALLRNDKEFRGSVLNESSDAPMMLSTKSTSWVQLKVSIFPGPDSLSSQRKVTLWTGHSSGPAPPNTALQLPAR